ncbi:MAG: hypothetical protein ACXACH_05615 [Candidatus Hermodarchaeia archaeon]
MNTQTINQQISHLSDVFTNILLDRGLLESQLFPVNAYISLACYNTYETQYEIMKQVWDRISPEKLAQRSKVLLSEVQGLAIMYQWLYYGLGRMGIIFNQCDNDPAKEPKEKQKEWRYLLQNWYQLGTHYFNTKKPTIEASGYTNLAFGEEVLTWLKDRLEPVTPSQVANHRKSIGTVDLYAFMDECEARAKIIEHGPYPLDEDQILVITEYTHLYDGKEDLWLPWSETETPLPSSSLGIAMTLSGVTTKFSDTGTMTLTPAEYGDHVQQMLAYTKHGEKLTALGLDEIAAFAEAADASQQELFMRFAEWDKQRLLIAGAKAYMRGFARYTNQVGITEQIDWELTPHSMKEYVPYFMTHDGDNAFARMFRSPEERVKDPTFYKLPEK